MAIVPKSPEDSNENCPLMQAYNNGFQPVPIIPLDACLSPSTSVNVNNRGKVPGIITGDGTWVGLSGWTKGEITETWIAAWGNTIEAGAGVGIRTGDVVGVDIDVTDENLSVEIGEIAFDVLGDAPCRIGNPPKRLLPYRTDTPRKKNRVEFHHPNTGDVQVVELLGTGQQFVAHGTHPKTGAPYEWSNGNPCHDLRPEDLTAVTDEQVETFIDAVKTAMFKAGYQVSETASRGTSRQRKPMGDPALVGDPEDVRKALDIIGNTEPNYDKWFRIVVAVKAALGGIEDHYSIYEDWALAWKDNTPDVVRAKWNSITDAEIGIAYLLSLAKRAADHSDDAALARYFEGAIRHHRDQMLSDAFSVITGTADSLITKNSSRPSIILSPPGLVGEIAAFHDSRSYREAPIYGVAAVSTAE